MAIERLHFVFGGGNADEELPYAVRAFKRLPVPRQGGVGSIEVGEVVDTRG